MKTTSKTTNADSKVKIAYSKKIEKRRCSDQKTRITICSLPNDLIVNILGHVASFSISDFFNTKLSGKLFNKLAKDYEDYIYNKLSLNEISCHPLDLCLNKEANSLFMRCLQSQNSEALYRQGVKEYLNFHQGKTSGLTLLKKAATIAHLGASYLLGIIVICKREDEGDLFPTITILSTAERKAEGFSSRIVVHKSDGVALASQTKFYSLHFSPFRLDDHFGWSYAG
ncbi:uncharacterized protein LOC133795758 [Humulus lupulus]|uniref:uncharacterized protein LOC133795758 n=1 Tax=Humulus lupulus TaxID=3486 RepID=UPI002B406807|nr:uncharacterized protein LOC133795758 [Humulus lupulus]